MSDLHTRIAELAAKATPGPWEIDSEYDDDAHYSGGGGCGRGFKNFFIGVPVDGKWRTLLDSANSDHKLVEEDFDEDGRSAWDSIGLANTSLTIELVNNLPAIIAALTAKADHDKVLAERDALEAENARLREAVNTLRNGYSDAISDYSYILTHHGRLSGVGFERVLDHYAQWVTIPEREGLLAGSHVVAALEAKP